MMLFAEEMSFVNLSGTSQCHLLPDCGVECTLDKRGTLLVKLQGSQGLKYRPTRLCTQYGQTGE